MSKTTQITRQDWEALRYPLSLRQLSEEEGGGWLAVIPMLGEGAFMADGETAAGAIAALEDLRRMLYDAVINSGQPIPLPTDATDEIRTASGKWMMRTTPRLHAELQEAAKRNGVSFNSYCSQCVARGHDLVSLDKEIKNILSAVPDVIASETAKAVADACADFARAIPRNIK